MTYDVMVIGGGASGMMAAIFSKNDHNRVAIIEKNERLGRKLLATGNGRCNFTNGRMDKDAYFGNEAAFKIIQRFSQQDVRSFFSDMGILFHEREGYYYPRSNQALCVRDRLEQTVLSAKVDVYTGCNVEEISFAEDLFNVETNDQRFTAKALIVCCGGYAYPQGGNTGFGLHAAKHFSHRIIPCVPALVPLNCGESFYKEIKGVRAFGQVTLFVDEKKAASDVGEIQFTKSGISGIPVFNISRYATKALKDKKKVYAVVDFFCDYSKEEVYALLIKEKDRIHDRESFLTSYEGYINDKLAGLFYDLLFGKRKSISSLSDADMDKLVSYYKNFRTDIRSSLDYSYAQVTSGGVPLSEVTDDLESKHQKGLYFAGEVLDVDGICGGYNLQWAWSSGYVAGCHAAKGKDK